MPRYALKARVDAAKRFGLRVEVVPGAESRGSSSYNPGCYVGHHTAGARTGDRPSLNLCVNGRADLAGPLCEDFHPRSGGLVIVATGRSNNAGEGGFRGIVGNSGTMACEAEDDGDGKWTPEQIRDYPRIVASGLWMMGRDASWYCSHRTWAPRRKIDPAGITDAWMQAQVAALLRAGGANPEEDNPMPTPEELWKFTIVNPETKVGQSAAARLLQAQANAADAVTLVNRLTAASATREAAILAAVGALAAKAGSPVDMAAITAAVDSAVERGLEDLDLRLTVAREVPE